MVGVQRRIAAQIFAPRSLLEGRERESSGRKSRASRANYDRVEVMIPEQFQIRDLTIRPAAVLAPMAGVTDTLVRRVIRGLGGGGAVLDEGRRSEGNYRRSQKKLRDLVFQPRDAASTAQTVCTTP